MGGVAVAVVAEHKRRYLIEDMGLTEEQIEEMLPSEIETHCDKVIQKRIDARGMIRTDLAPAESKVGEKGS